MSRPRDTSIPHRFLVDRMRSIEAAVTTWVHDQVMADGSRDLTVAHARVLAELGRGSRPSELARRLGVTKGAIGQLVDLLEERGYVTRDPDPTDRRAHIVRPTPRTLAAYRVSRGALVAVEDEWRAILGAELLADLERALETLENRRSGLPTKPDASPGPRLSAATRRADDAALRRGSRPSSGLNRSRRTGRPTA